MCEKKYEVVKIIVLALLLIGAAAFSWKYPPVNSVATIILIALAVFVTNLSELAEFNVFGIVFKMRQVKKMVGHKDSKETLWHIHDRMEEDYNKLKKIFDRCTCSDEIKPLKDELIERVIMTKTQFAEKLKCITETIE